MVRGKEWIVISPGCSVEVPTYQTIALKLILHCALANWNLNNFFKKIEEGRAYILLMNGSWYFVLFLQILKN